MAAARLIELRFSRRNIKDAGQTDEGDWSRRTFPAMVALHTSVIVATFLWGGSARLRWLALLIAAQPVRAWVLLSLGRNWNARGAVARDSEVVTTGPYAYVRHPNYAVVIIELAALPAAFGLVKLSIVATLVNAVLLKIRINEEEALLFEMPEYRRHFVAKRRFLPFFF
jgi:methyltransferase